MISYISVCFTGNPPNVVYFNCSLLSVIWRIKYYYYYYCYYYYYFYIFYMFVRSLDYFLYLYTYLCMYVILLYC